MPSPDVLDFTKLLGPIPGDSPTGVDPRLNRSHDSLYYVVRGARTAARAAERQMVTGEDEAGGNVPDWRPVLQNGIKLLSEHSKDLEITAYVTEALVRLKGFAGLRDGFRLARELVELYWDGLFPMPDEDGVETRVAALVGLNGDEAEGTLIVPIAKAPLTAESSVGAFSASQYKQAQDLAKITDPKQRERRIQSGTPAMETLQKAAAETPGSVFNDLVQDIRISGEEFAKLCRLVEEKGQGYAIPSSNLRMALEAAMDVVKDLGRDKLKAFEVVEAAAVSDVATVVEAAAGGANGPARSGDVVASAIRGREDAFQQILKLSEYFRRTEPHSVVSYALEQVVHWGRMPLPELLATLVADEESRKKIFKQVGITPPESS